MVPRLWFKNNTPDEIELYEQYISMIGFGVTKQKLCAESHDTATVLMLNKWTL